MICKEYPELWEKVWWDKTPEGLTVAVVPRPGFTRKLAYLVTDFGSIDREFTLDGKEITAPAGVAHYLEHKLFDMPGRDVSEEFAAMGAMVNAFTGYDMTAYYFSVTENFDKCLKLLLEFVTTPYFTQDSVQREQGIIGQEIDMNEDNPETRLFENLMAAMYESHRIAEPILGTRSTIANITPQVLTQTHRAFYRPDNLLLCVVGDVDPEAVFRSACAAAKTMPRVTARPKEQAAEPMTCSQNGVKAFMDVAMPMFQLGFKCESLGSGKEAVRQELIGDLAAEMLFGESSALYLQLYEQGLIDSSFGGGFETVKGMAMLTASGDSFDPEAVKEAILQQAQALLEKGISREDFMRCKRSALGRRMRDMDSFDSLCFRICAYHFSGFDYFDFPEVYGAIGPDDLLSFIRRVVTPQRSCLSVIYPNTKEA